MFKSQMHNNRPVVMAAGGTFDSGFEGGITVELLDYTMPGKIWEQST